MTSQTQLRQGPVILRAAPSDALAGALDQIAYGCLAIYVFAIPWEESAPLLGGFAITRWLGLVAIGILFLRILATRQIRKLSPLHYPMLALVGWAALSILWTIDWESTAARTGTYFQQLAAVWIIWELAVTENRVLGLLQSYVLGTLISSFGTIANFMMGRTAAQLAATRGKEVWETSRYTMSGFNENDLGLMLALSIPLSLYLVASRRGSLIKLLCWLQIVASTTAILLTGSRGSLLAATVSFAMFPVIVYRLPLRWQRLVAVGACMAVVACGVYFVPETSWRRLSNMVQEASEGTLTHRTLIWTAGLDVFRDNAFFGVGSGAYGSAVLKAVGVSYVAHNTFLSVLVELGVVGALILFALLTSLFYCAVRMRPIERSLWIAVLSSWVVGVFALTWEYRKPTWLLFGIMAAHVYAYRAQKPPALSGNGVRSVPRWR